MRAIELYNLDLPQDMVVSLHSMVKIEAFLSFFRWWTLELRHFIGYFLGIVEK